MGSKEIHTLKHRNRQNGGEIPSLYQLGSNRNTFEQHKLKKTWLNFSLGLNIVLISLLGAYIGVCRLPKIPVKRENECSGRGWYIDDHVEGAKCRCYPCFQGTDCAQVVNNCVIHVNQGDPTMYESYWIRNAEATAVTIRGHELGSYFSNRQNLCWFMEPSLEKEIRTLHELVGNVVTQGRYIVVGTGSSQLFQAALYALSSQELTKMNVFAAAPYYSVYPAVTDYLQAGVYKWAATHTRQSTETPYIEVITSPNNPSGEIRHAVLNDSKYQIYDLAYYWPQYTPISSTVDEDIVLFTLSKTTGHAGSRIGWAIVKDEDVAKRMVKAIELTTIGVSKDSQIRASQILKHINGIYSKIGKPPLVGGVYGHKHLDFFHYAYSIMEYRWKRLFESLGGGNRFSLPQFQTEFCKFFGQETTSHPAYAWVKCEVEEDCQQVFEDQGIQARGGSHFGADPKYVRETEIRRKQDQVNKEKI